MKLSKTLLAVALSLALAPALLYPGVEAQADPQSGTRKVPKDKQAPKQKERTCRTVTKSEICGYETKCVYTDIDGDGKAEKSCFDFPKFCKVTETVCQ